ncbi:MAG: hypothetical protein WAK48_00920 [Candidatus Acidiferrum sp.]
MLNALHFFFLKISKPSALAAMTVLTFFFFWLINFHGVPGVPRIDSLLRIGIPDMMFSYSPSSIHSKLAQFGSEGRRAYRLFLERVDFIFPVVYGFFFVMTITFGLARLFPNRRSLQKFSLLPLAATFFDYAENGCFLILLHSYPRELQNIEKLANVFTLAKWAFAAISILLLFAVLLELLIRNSQNALQHS